MKRNYILVAGIAAALTLSLASCGDDFLTKAPQGVLDKETMASSTGVDLMTTAAYATLAAPVDGFDPYQASPFNYVWGGIYGGDANKGF